MTTAPQATRRAFPLDRAAAAVGLCGVFLAAFFPLHNPDLFWHLAAGRKMAELGRPLFEEPLALAGPGGLGLPWVGFEWLSELFFYRAWTLGGFVGLVFLKAALACATGWQIDAALRRARCAPALRTAALLSFAALSQKRWMLEPELFTFLFLALLWRRIESRRSWDRRGTLLWTLLFALWANLHGGFIYGLGLLTLSLARGGRPWWSKLMILASCAAATLATPYGPRAYTVAFHLLGELSNLRRENIEWISPALIGGLPPKLYFLLPLSGLALLWRKARRAEPVEPGRLLTLALFGLWGGLSLRNIAVASAVLVPLCFALLDRELRRFPALRGRAAAGAALALSAAGLWALAAQTRVLGSPWAGVCWAGYPRELTEAAARIAPTGTLYAPFDWAGYPAWRFYPERRVFAYGRLDVFHDRLSRAARMRAQPFAWAGFLEREGVEAALEKPPTRRLAGFVDVPRTRERLRTTRSPFAAYYPPERWALAHWSEEGFLFVRKRPGRTEWLDPTDADYLRLCVRQGWLDARRVCREAREHRRLVGESRWDGALLSFCP